MVKRTPQKKAGVNLSAREGYAASVSYKTPITLLMFNSTTSLY